MYLLDSNVFVEAARTYYSPDIAPSFWDWLLEQHDKGAVASIAQVKDELTGGSQEDFLSEWAKSAPSSFWLEPLADAPGSFQELYAWATDPERSFKGRAIDEFFRVADSYLVAEAHAQGHTVVTFEQPQPNARKRILIPNACLGLGVPYVNPFEVYRKLELRFS